MLRVSRPAAPRPRRVRRHLVCGFASPAVIEATGTMRIVRGKGVFVWVRTAGLMGAVELVRDKATKEPFPAQWGVPARVRRACIARRVIVRASVDTIVVCPPLTITPAQVDQVARVIAAAIEEVSQTLPVG